MYVLGIETSCDETAASIVKDGRRILSSVVSSSLAFHREYGGVVPEIASRMQLELITRVFDSAFKKSHIGLKDVRLICVTSCPGLLGSLLVGVSFAKSVSIGLGIPILGINHLHGHIYANFLNNEKIKLPFVALVVSGGHTSLFYVKDFNKIEILGQTQDDACGEAFDKVAKVLKLGYPGGPIIEKLALKGDRKKIKFRCSGTKGLLDFSFSGIKTAVLYLVRNRHLTIKEKMDIAASFQEAVFETLMNKCVSACRLKKVNTLVIGGGVAANNRLREKFYETAREKGLNCFFPAKDLCVDNAAMVAGLGYQLFKRGYRSDLSLTGSPDFD